MGGQEFASTKRRAPIRSLKALGIAGRCVIVKGADRWSSRPPGHPHHTRKAKHDGVSHDRGARPGQVPGDEPGELVRRLGSTQFAEREAASAVLEAIGPAALPALRAVSGFEDLDLRNRTAAIVAKIEGGTEPGLSDPARHRSTVLWTMCSKASDSSSPSRLAWHPDTPEAIRRRRVTIRDPAPLPFWPAIDRICRAGESPAIPGSPGGIGDGRPPQFRLFLAPGRVDCPRADHGPLRLEWTTISHSRYINLIPYPDPPVEWPGRGGPPAPFPPQARQLSCRRSEAARRVSQSTSTSPEDIEFPPQLLHEDSAHASTLPGELPT